MGMPCSRSSGPGSPLLAFSEGTRAHRLGAAHAQLPGEPAGEVEMVDQQLEDDVAREVGHKRLAHKRRRPAASGRHEKAGAVDRDGEARTRPMRPAAIQSRARL